MRSFTVLWQGDSSELIITDVETDTDPHEFTPWEWVKLAAETQKEEYPMSWDDEGIAALKNDFCLCGVFEGSVTWFA